ncbi:DNA-binding response regulator [Agrobacterium vitis]|nr:DNA-binding response regulator [Agrobacterium vitis]
MGGILITALKNRKPDGEPYARVTEIEAKLEELAGTPREEILARAQIRSRTNPDYIPSECLLYFLRGSKQENSETWFEHLYKALIERVMRSLPKPESIDGETASLTKEAIRDKVVDRFLQLLAFDRQDYATKLDFFEIRFDMALKRLRQDAEKQAWRDEKRSVTLEFDDETGDVSAEVEAAAERLNPVDLLENSDEASRLRLEAAIDALPIEQKRTIHMIRLGMQMHSTDPEVLTIAKVLGVMSAKTIWNYRERAIKSLRAALYVEVGQ